MCQAHEGEARHVARIERKYGSYRAFIDGKKPLKDYCAEHDDYWCGCPKARDAQADPKTRAKRRKRQKRPF